MGIEPIRRNVVPGGTGPSGVRVAGVPRQADASRGAYAGAVRHPRRPGSTSRPSRPRVEGLRSSTSVVVCAGEGGAPGQAVQMDRCPWARRGNSSGPGGDVPSAPWPAAACSGGPVRPMLWSRSMCHANGQLSFSATDLSRHLFCTHLTSLRRAVAFGELKPPPPYDNPRAEVLRQRGVEHERRLRERFATAGRTVEAIIRSDTPFSHRGAATAATRTREAMSRGADVIYQGRLEDDGGRWSGYPDFLLRVDTPSALGGWSYEVLDTKLARRAKGEALLQLLLYSDLLAQAQSIGPELMHLALGGGGSENPASFRVAEYAAYYRAVRRRFEAHAASPPDTYPEPVEHCGICEWQQSCAARRGADDHLSLVAGITRGQRGNRRPSTRPAASSSTRRGACTRTSARSRRSSSTRGGSTPNLSSAGRRWSGRGRWPGTACASFPFSLSRVCSISIGPPRRQLLPGNA